MRRHVSKLAVLFLSGVISSATLADSQYFHKKLTGSFDGRYAFTMDLKDVDGSLTGSYRYAGKRNDIYLNGKIDPSGNFTIDETGVKGQRTGTFTGKLDGDTLKGTWASAQGHRRFPFEAHQISEVVIGSKHEILTRAIGTYTLDHISGWGGANGMWETWRDGGVWSSNQSSIYMARREFSDVSLTKADLHRLNTLTVKVDRALTTRLSVDGKVLLTIPYGAGMQYEMTQDHDSTVGDELKMLSPSTTVHDERLYLLARDAIDFVPAMSGSFLPNDSLDIATMSYSVVDKTFDVDLQDGKCCGGTIFTFRRTGP
jgi:hypothetical protein